MALEIIEIIETLNKFYCTTSKINPLKVPKRILVPQKPVKSRIDPNKLPQKTLITAETIALLERLSLVDCANREGIKTLEAAIEFADQILQVNTQGVEPLITVLEDK
ncbi:glutamyl-tRNA(Gln) amidotransferase subunit C, mitochondrial [Onthophagus taurus]|uniref:glutamyl-tRNA(Gln) amidotransferase subunit C, mitochondrial n=1 Tax=Onthophagus taurus TaxID=166361 RepID=UPI0039BE8AF2